MPAPPVALNFSERGQPTEFTRRGPVNRWASAALLLLTSLVPSLAMGGEPPAGDIAPPPSAETPVQRENPSVAPVEKRAKPPATREQKRKVVILTSILLAGILTVLLFLLLWIGWWSRRTHRLLRAPLPTADRGDELWYLKTKRASNLTPEQPTPGRPPLPPT